MYSAAGTDDALEDKALWPALLKRTIGILLDLPKSSAWTSNNALSDHVAQGVREHGFADR